MINFTQGWELCGWWSKYWFKLFHPLLLKWFEFLVEVFVHFLNFWLHRFMLPVLFLLN